MIKAIRLTGAYCLPFFLLTLLTGCSKDQENSLRSDNDEISYWENNRRTAANLSEFMYNQADPDNARERFKLVHISDAHLSDWSSDNHGSKPKNLIEAVRFANQPELRINAMVHTGDHISTNIHDSRAKAMSLLSTFANFYYASNSIPSFVCIGNHDSNMMNTDLSQMVTWQDMNSILFAKQKYPMRTDAGRNYFYADMPDPQGGVIRIISLDPTDQDGKEYNTLHQAVFSQRQINWFCHKALKENMTEEHSVIVLLHYPLTADLNQQRAASYEKCFEHAYPWGMIPEIMEAFRSKKSHQWVYPDKITQNPERNIEVDVDFSRAPGEFICYLGGHIHTYASYKVGGIRNADPNLPQQHMVICNNMSPSEIGSIYNTIMRKSNSAISNSFNVYAVDTKEKKVYITFFGAHIPSDEPGFEPVQSFSYL